MISHGELILRRPDPRYLGSFYFYLALGGALGGIFTGILAPLFFNGYWELHIAVAGCVFLFFHLWRGEKSPEKRRDKVAPKRLSYYIPPVFISLVLIIHVFHYHRHTVYSARSFFSVLRVEEKVVKTPPSRVRFLMHGITTHGFQFTEEQFEFVPTCYYGPQSGAGLALRRHPKRVEGRSLTVAAIGLGIGTVSAYGREGDNFDFFEIDPNVADLARGKMGFFSFIENCVSDVRIITGDGRISLKRAAEADAKREGIYDVLILDAFSSDSVPTHLLTREAFELYFRTLKKDGILAVHTSNRTLAISWIVIRQSMHIDIPSAVIITDGDEFTFSSEWVLVTRNPAFLDLPAVSENLVPYDLFEQRYDLHVWTDQYCNLFEIVKNW
jgi:hypothetical protein